jgi:endogenous inhibitor of DNA gyrase (YacG/DUF329 family)
MLSGCPGADKIKNPVPAYRNCPLCGEEVEVWSDEFYTTCPKCGAIVVGEHPPACVEWCKYARECLGLRKYNRLMQEKQVYDALNQDEK